MLSIFSNQLLLKRVLPAVEIVDPTLRHLRQGKSSPISSAMLLTICP